jgi:hypothetical protein
MLYFDVVGGVHVVFKINSYAIQNLNYIKL